MTDKRKSPAKKQAKAKAPKKSSSGKLKEVALRPAAEEFGSAYALAGRAAGETATRVTRTFLRVVDATVHGANVVFDWLGEALAPRLEDIPPDKIADPEPRILLPAANALAYSMEDELIREMFANLIAANMQLDKRSSTHPAFVAMIKEMQPSDAKLLLELQSKGHIQFEMRYYQRSQFRTIGAATTVPIGVVPASQVALSLDNLVRLRLAEIRDNQYPVGAYYDTCRETFRESFAPIQKSIAAGIHSDKDGNKPKLQLKERGFYLTSLGTNFVSICLKAKS